MNVWTRLEAYKSESNRPVILALGNFDGLHQGHQKIIRQVVERAAKKGGIASVLTFAEHPQRVLHGMFEPALLTSPQHRLLLLRQLGVECCFLLSFTMEFSRIPADTFVERWLVEKLGVKEIHLGYNARFGFERGGDSSTMKQLSKRFGFAVYEAEPVKIDGEFVSSTLIRQAIQKGDLTKVQMLFGRKFSILATVVRGKGRGRTLGFPTANLRCHSEILPPRGVYPAEVREHGFHLRPTGRESEFEYVEVKPSEWHQGILNFGVRPTFEKQGEALPEVHLLNFSGDLYGKTVEVVFHPMLRDEEVFRGSEDLIRAIKGDIDRTKHYFSHH